MSYDSPEGLLVLSASQSSYSVAGQVPRHHLLQTLLPQTARTDIQPTLIQDRQSNRQREAKKEVSN